LFGGTAGGALLTEGVTLGAGGLLLRYSRGAETQADVMGTQVLYDAGYDPRAMAQFFEKLQGETAGKNPPQFLSDHPSVVSDGAVVVARQTEIAHRRCLAPENSWKNCPRMVSAHRCVGVRPGRAGSALIIEVKKRIQRCFLLDLNCCRDIR
jgi:hypothetical protein